MRQCPTCRQLFAEEVAFCPHDGAATDSPADSRLGELLDGGIRLLDVLGRGAMGTVYEGLQVEMERRVAVKMLHGDLGNDPTFVERFMREAVAVARLDHPNIVTVHMIGRQRDRPFIVMELIDGETVEAHIDRGPISPERTIRVARQVVSALADAHAAKVIHRDLKPANVLLSQRRRAADFVKILDFGVARMIDVDARLTADGVVFGTPAYLSPEQANGVEVDHRSDLYSLGVMMFEMLSGALPFRGNQVKLLLSHVKEPPPLLAEVAPHVPADLAALVASLLAKSPDDRPASAEAVADILDRIAGAESMTPWASAALPEAARASLLETAAPRSSDAAASSAEIATKPVWVGPRATGEGGAGDRGGGEEGGRAAPPRRPWRLVFAAVLLAAAALGAALALGPFADRLPTHAIDLPAAAPSPAAQPPPPAPPIDAGSRVANEPLRPAVPRRSIMVGQEGYSLRVLEPRRLVVGVEYAVSIDVWDPDGEPIDVDRIPVWVIGPESEKAPAALPGETRGRFELRVTLDHPGEHQLKILPPGVQQPVVIHFDVLDPAS